MKEKRAWRAGMTMETTERNDGDNEGPSLENDRDDERIGEGA